MAWQALYDYQQGVKYHGLAGTPKTQQNKLLVEACIFESSLPAAQQLLVKVTMSAVSAHGAITKLTEITG